MDQTLIKIKPCTIRKDIERISKLHSWYKHIKWPSEEFVLVFRIGEVPRYNFDRCVTDTEGLHLDIARKVDYVKSHPDAQNVIMENTVNISPMFRGNEGTMENPYVLLPRVKLGVWIEFMKEQGVVDYDFKKEHSAQDAEVYEKERQRIISEVVDKGTIIAKSLGLLDEE